MMEGLELLVREEKHTARWAEIKDGIIDLFVKQKRNKATYKKEVH